MSRPFRLCTLIVLVGLALAPGVDAKKGKKGEPKTGENETEDAGPLSAETLSGLKFRTIGPALTSGRIADLAVSPTDPDTWFVAAASGGVWKTTNHGTTFTPVFDSEGSYSIGCVSIDPNNPAVVWVGTGENNSQRSVGLGDGVYKSVDGGKSWENVGLQDSEHIGKILIDPRDSDVVYVAAQGPLWNPGGERGLYKSVDGGDSWKLVLEISENTGVTDVVFHPQDPDTLYAAAYQRRRRVWTLIDGGPESTIYKSTDAGASWDKAAGGLPETDLGRIGLAVTPAAPDTVYAIVEAEHDESGFYRSTDRAATWSKQSDYVSGSPQYYQEIVADPLDADRVYSLDTWMQVSEDAGKSFDPVGEKHKHVDNHSLWIDPENTDHLIAGCDGGIYETYDRGATWRFSANLPITQFYRIQPDNDFPFYNVYGGTQDNFTLGGPSRTVSANGITNREWFIVLGGDGFEPQIDPENPDIIYAQYQNGGLARFDRASGESIDIQPQVDYDQDPLRWNWDSALIISPHSNTRLYYAAQRVFRSDDRGDTWTPISGDLTRALDRNQLETMGRIQKIDAVAKSASTSQYGNIVVLSESTLTEGLLYAGADDGLIQVLEGDAWRKIESFPGIPELSYVSDIEASRHAADRVYAAFDDHKSGDFRPFLLRSDDRGATWRSIAGDLPERGTVYTVVEDHVDPNLLFAGTEFGVYVTVDGGKKWIRLKGGLPVIAVRDLDIQRRENDLVVGTFGRGIYILDDYSVLRHIDEASLEAGSALYPVKRAWMFMESTPLGLPGKSFQGDAFYTAPNPPVGATVTYYLKETLETRKEKRQKTEKEHEEADDPYDYPTWEDMEAEQREESPLVVLTVTDADGNVVRRLSGSKDAGIHRVTWDLRYPSSRPTRLEPPSFDNPFEDPPRGPMVVPGTYRVSLAQRVDGEWSELAGPVEFEVVALVTATLGAEDKQALLAFQLKVARLQRAVLGAGRAIRETDTRLEHLRKAYEDTPGAALELAGEIRALEDRLADIDKQFNGDRVRGRRNEPTHRSISRRVGRIVSAQWSSSSAPTQTNIDAYHIAGKAFGKALADLQRLIEQDLTALEEKMEQAGAPWTPGRVPRWEME
ncbi:MAG: glycosyl hydrolase [Acidobacteria bacterium]|nr:MAG: glycosyl hydrolase [Acidobacteriota bacterium]